MWKFYENTSPGYKGANNHSLESFNGDESIVREILQNSLDAKRQEEDYVKFEIIIREKQNEELPGYEELKETMERCHVFFEDKNDSKSLSKIKKMIDEMEGNNHYLISFVDKNTKGLDGDLDNPEDGSNLNTLIYGMETTNKNTTESTGGSFGIGKNAPFVKTKINTIFYETLNQQNKKYYIGKTLQTTHKKNDIKYDGIGYLESQEEIKNYIGKYALEELGTAVHVPFYDMDNSKEEISKIIRDVLKNFIVAIYKKELIVEIKDEINHENYFIQKDTINELINMLKESLNKKEINSIIDQFDLLELGEKKIINIDEENYIEYYILKGEKSSMRNKYINIREKLMYIFEKSIKNFPFPYDALCIYYGNEINRILRDAEPPEHNKWIIKNLNSKEDKDYYRRVIEKVEKAIKSEFEIEGQEEFSIKELNDIMDEEKKLENKFFIRRATEKRKKEIKDNKGEEESLSKKINTNKKIKNKTNDVINNQINEEGNVLIKVKTIKSPTKKIRVKGNTYNFTLNENGESIPINNRKVSLWVKTDNGNDEELKDFKILENTDKVISIETKEKNMNLKIYLEEHNEIN